MSLFASAEASSPRLRVVAQVRLQALEHERHAQQLLGYAVVQLARDALALGLLGGDDAR